MRLLLWLSIAAILSPAAAVAGGTASPPPLDLSLVKRVEILHEIMGLQLTPGQSRTIIQQLSTVDREEDSLADAEGKAAQSIMPELRRIQDAFLGARSPDPADQSRMHAAMAPLQPQQEHFRKVEAEAVQSIRSTLNRTQLDRLRQELGLGSAVNSQDQLPMQFRQRWMQPRIEPAPQGDGEPIQPWNGQPWLFGAPQGAPGVPHTVPPQNHALPGGPPAVVPPAAKTYLLDLPLGEPEVNHPADPAPVLIAQLRPATAPVQYVASDYGGTVEDDEAVRLFFLRPEVLSLLRTRAAHL